MNSPNPARTTTEISCEVNTTANHSFTVNALRIRHVLPKHRCRFLLDTESLHFSHSHLLFIQTFPQELFHRWRSPASAAHSWHHIRRCLHPCVVCCGLCAFLHSIYVTSVRMQGVQATCVSERTEVRRDGGSHRAPCLCQEQLWNHD